ncbi:hypothetical protein [Streptomyces sp. S.PB5]|uniref:hypothetical protein n=1 Tax=Streptomyces sp. S.PB5 TaxID=3020844 RepID=UPI0025AEDCC6|nr:hypothetical protein [Streptomyces sp. S.PB5]MDN3021836.1 hypothetical protein [Streptomyces sp. S.PB5]
MSPGAAEFEVASVLGEVRTEQVEGLVRMRDLGLPLLRRAAVPSEDRGGGEDLEATGAPSVGLATEEGERRLDGVLAPYRTQAAPRRPERTN